MDIELSLLLRIGCALLGILLLIYVGRSMLIKKWPKGRAFHRSIVIIDSIPLPHQHSIWLIEIDKKRFIVANTKESCHVLSDYKE